MRRGRIELWRSQQYIVVNALRMITSSTVNELETLLLRRVLGDSLTSIVVPGK